MIIHLLASLSAAGIRRAILVVNRFGAQIKEEVLKEMGRFDSLEIEFFDAREDLANIYALQSVWYVK